MTDIQARHADVDPDEPEFPHTDAETLEDLVDQRYSRRGFLKFAGAAGAAAAVPTTMALTQLTAAAQGSGDAAAGTVEAAQAIGFTEVAPTTIDDIVLPPGYRYTVLASWGDPLFPNDPPFDVNTQTGASQARRVGFNHDMLVFYPLDANRNPAWTGVRPGYWTGNSSRGVIAINHEYTDGYMMFPGYDAATATRTQVEVEWEAHGVSIIEVNRNADNTYSMVRDTRYNRRITATTPMVLSGPAAGHPLLQTPADPTGTQVRGTLNNCAGGVTPWGTYLTCEENSHQYFANNNAVADATLRERHARYTIPGGSSERRWEAYDDRFDVSKPAGANEPFRHFYTVEIDPYDPASTPKKRTALGRFKHEGAEFKLASNGRMAVYQGCDARFEYIYKFVPTALYTPSTPRQNDILDSGKLYVAKFNADGTGTWILLADSAVPSTVENFVLTRQAADAAGATPMDRPEDIEVNDVNGKIYVLLTNNTNRVSATGQTRTEEGRVVPSSADAANPRGNNRNGHLLEITEDGDDPWATTFRWNVFLFAGSAPSSGNLDTASVTRAGTASNAASNYTFVTAMGAPDNCTFDQAGNIWIITDGAWRSAARWNDACFVAPTSGTGNPTVRQFASSPFASEICGVYFSPDQRTLFFNIQHPGEAGQGGRANTRNGLGSLANPLSTWNPGGGVPSRPATVCIVKNDGGRIGT